MKPQSSSLNPYAASYVPLFKREAERGSKNYDGTVWFQGPQHTPNDQQHHVHSNTERASKPEPFPVKTQPASSSYTSSAQNVAGLTDKSFFDEEFDMDVEYLRMTFPGISEQSLVDVYTVNNGDLDSAIDMLHQLEFDGVESPGSLPETLDIGDVSESGSAGDTASLKQKTVAAETSTSSPSSNVASANVS